ncbi:hypothetical protein [Sphingomonas paucimobilis]|uniref:hypothetical protein n=1 Tax=Sphingomonas paucimobilis TaxID=13689 RepID=UPI0031DC004E
MTEHQSLSDFMQLAQEINDSPSMMAIFASPEFDELSDDGKQWVAGLVRETIRRTGGKSPRRVDIRVETQVRWSMQFFFRATRRHAGGIVLGFCPSFFAIGGELITGETRGIALMIGPFWLGFAAAAFKAS